MNVCHKRRENFSPQNLRENIVGGLWNPFTAR